MAMIPLAAFAPLILPYAPTAPEPLYMQHLRLAAREFCKETRCWREVVTTEVTANPILPNVAASSTIVAVQSCKLNGRELAPVPFDEADIEKYLVEQGQAAKFTQDSEDRFIILPFEAGTLVMSVYLAPAAGPQNIARDPQREPQNLVPGFLFDEHVEAIAHGALARLLAIPKQEYTNDSMAAFFAMKFADDKAKASTMSIKGKQRAPIRTRARWF